MNRERAKKFSTSVLLGLCRAARCAALLSVVSSSLIGLEGCRKTSEQTAAVRPASGGSAWFEEVTREVGIDFVHRSGHGQRYWFPELVGGGV